MTYRAVGRAPSLGRSDFRRQLEVAENIVMRARRCTADQAFDELFDIATRHHLDFAYFVEEFSEVADNAARLSKGSDPYSARSIAIEHCNLLIRTALTCRPSERRAAS